MSLQCYVMTANLDGETSLKTRVSAPLTRELRTEAQAGGMFGCIGGSHEVTRGHTRS